MAGRKKSLWDGTFEALWLCWCWLLQSKEVPELLALKDRRGNGGNRCHPDDKQTLLWLHPTEAQTSRAPLTDLSEGVKISLTKILFMSVR